MPGGGARERTKGARARATVAARGIDPRFAPVVAAFAGDRDVTCGGKGFGATGLKVNGKLFAMVTSKGAFVAKLPRTRVDELVGLGRGEYFDPGHGRRMTEWFATHRAAPSWIELAKEARRFVGGRGP
jgi:hypothetical protein